MKNLLEDVDPDDLQRILRLMRPVDPAERAAKLRELAAEGQIDEALLSSLLEFFPTEPAPELSIGDRFGKYTITDLLGEGGMGRVYQAWDPDLTRNVAIKLIRSDLLGLSEEYHKRGLRAPEEMFREESAALASLQHAGIVSIFERGIAPGPGGSELPYCAMELVNGDPLRRYCEERRLGIDECLELMRQVCAAVGYAHSRKIVHRDLKPGNILIDHDGQPRILDFGLAVVLDKCSPVDLLSLGVGSPGYLAPEQISHEFGKVGYATDVYALGVILYELLGKRRPYHANPADSSFRTIITRTEPQKLGTFLRECSGEIEEIVATCLAKHPAERYPNANVLQSVLTACLEKRRLTRLAKELGLKKDGPPPLPAPLPGKSPVRAPAGHSKNSFEEDATLPHIRTTPDREASFHGPEPAMMHPGPSVAQTAPIQRPSHAPSVAAAYSTAGAVPVDPGRSARLKVWLVAGTVCVTGSALIVGSLIGNRSEPTGFATFEGIQNLRRALLDGAGQFDSGEYREAEKTFDAILGKEPENELALLGRALSRRELGDNRGATADLARLSASRDPGVLEALERTGVANAPGKPELSLAAAFSGAPADRSTTSPVATTPPSTPPESLPERPPLSSGDAAGLEADYQRGVEAMQSGDLTRAIATLKSVDARSPGYKEVKMNLAFAHFNSGDPVSAIRVLDEVIAANPEANNAYNFRGQYHLATGNSEQAVADFTRFLRLSPEFSIGYNYRGLAHLDLEQYAEAETDFTKLIELEPQSSVSHEFRGRARIGLGEFNEALADLDRAARISPDDADIYYFRSKALRGLGRSEEADADMAKALRLNPGVVERNEDP